MTVSIRTALAVLPSGDKGVDLSWSEVGRYLGEYCDGRVDKDREKRHVRRDELYADGGVDVIKSVIDEVFEDPSVRDRRKKWAPYARFNNALKRIVNELSTVYSAPAKRSVEGDENDVRYQEVLKLLEFDTVMQEANRLYNLHRVIWVRPRVRVRPDGTREPVIDIATPSTCRVVLHPNDNTMVVGLLIRVRLRTVRGGLPRKAEWVLWTDHEWIHLDEHMVPIESTLHEHGLGLNPWVQLVRRPGLPGFWSGEEGEDLVAAQISIGMANVLLLKETKSATKQTFFSGETASLARDQSMDSEVPAELGEGTAASTVDMSMDLESFQGVADHVLEHAANNYGMSAAQMKHQGVQSADARELMRVPLRELRREQQPAFRRFEAAMAMSLATVLQRDMPELAFSTDGWRMDFGEAQTPLTPREELDQFERERAAGLDNTVAFVMRRNPDLDADQAQQFVLDNIDVETWRVREMRQLQAVSGAMGETQNGSDDSDPTAGVTAGTTAAEANEAPQDTAA